MSEWPGVALWMETYLQLWSFAVLAMRSLMAPDILNSNEPLESREMSGSSSRFSVLPVGLEGKSPINQCVG